MDKFDEIWKNRFNEGSLPSEDWNTPDAEVWKGIALQPPIKEKNRWRLLFWWGGFGLLIALSMVTYWSLTGGEQQSENLILIQEKQENSATQLLAEKEQAQDVKKPDNTSRIHLIEAKNEKVKNRNITKQPKDIQLKKSSVPASREYYTNPLETLEETTKAAKATENILRATLPKITHSTPTPFAPIAGRMALLPFAEANNPEPDLAKVNPVIEEKSTALQINYSLGAVYWRHRISDQYQSDLAPFDFNYSDEIGWQTGINAAWNWNQYFAVFAGLQYERIQVFSGHNSALTYDPAGETSISASNDYSLDLATPYGLSGAEFRFSRSGDIGSESVDLLVDFKSKHQIENWSLPLGILLFPFGKNQRFIPSATIGFGFNYLSNISNSIQSIDTHHDAIQFDNTSESSFIKPTIKQWHYDYRLGLGINYKILPDVQLTLQGDWARGLPPIFSQVDYQTRVDRYHLSVGLVKSFK